MKQKLSSPSFADIFLGQRKVKQTFFSQIETPITKAELPRKALVYADKGYDSMENKETLRRMKLKSRIMHKGTRGHEITERQQRINVAISKTRYKVRTHLWFYA